MALVFADRVKETSATTGTGSLSLAGAMTGFQAFSDTMADGDNCYYTITDGIDWEVGYGTYETTGNLLIRTTVVASSNADAAVNWTSGTEVFMTHPAVISLNTVLNANFATDNSLVRFDGTSGLAIQDSSIIIDDSNNMSGIGNIALSGLVDGRDIATDGARLDVITDANYLNSNTTKSQVGLGNVDNTSDATKLAATLLAVYPVGAIYTSVSSTDPSTLFGGTWASFGAGRVLVGRDSGDTDFDTAEETGGAKTHTLTTSEMPSHSHTHPGANSNWKFGGFYDNSGVSGKLNIADSGSGVYMLGSSGGYGDLSMDRSTASSGSGGSHNNLQPYIVVYMWKRTA